MQQEYNNNNNNMEKIVSDLQNEISQLQGEWAAVSEYCNEVQQQQRDTQEELAAVDLEEKLLTKKLQELVGPSEFPELFGGVSSSNNNNTDGEKNKATRSDDPFRTLGENERRRALEVVFKEDEARSPFLKKSAETQARHLSTEQEMAYDFVFGDDRRNKGKIGSAVSDAGALDYSSTILRTILDEHQETLEVSKVLQKQKEILTSKMQQCGAVSVALEAMLLYRGPPNGSY